MRTSSVPTIGKGCFVAAGAKIFNGAALADGSGVALGGIVHVNARVAAGSERADAARSGWKSGDDLPAGASAGSGGGDEFLSNRV